MRNEVQEMVNGVNNTVNTSYTNPVTVNTAAVEKTTYKPDIEKLESIYAEQKSYIEGLQGATKQIGYQLNGLALSESNSSKSSLNSLYNLAGMSKINGLSGMQNYFNLFVQNPNGGFSVDLSGVSPEVQEKLVAKAKDDVSEGGYFGVEKTSQRLFDFAQALTGGDPAKMEKMRQVIDKAFAQVGKLFGGFDNMPEISKKTYDATMQKFKDYAAATAKNNKTTDLEGTA